MQLVILMKKVYYELYQEKHNFAIDQKLKDEIFRNRQICQRH